MDQFVLTIPWPGHALLSCRGPLDLASRPELGRACTGALEHSDAQLVVDLRGVEFMDCGSLRLLDRTATLQESRGGGFRLVCEQDFLLRLLHLEGFSERHQVIPGVTEPAGRAVSSRDRARPSAPRAAR